MLINLCCKNTHVAKVMFYSREIDFDSTAQTGGLTLHPTTPLLQVALAAVGHYSGTGCEAVHFEILFFFLNAGWILKRPNFDCGGHILSKKPF